MSDYWSTSAGYGAKRLRIEPGLRDGDVFQLGDVLLIGTRPRSEAELIVARIVREVFSPEFLRQIGEPVELPTGEGIMKALRERVVS